MAELEFIKNKDDLHWVLLQGITDFYNGVISLSNLEEIFRRNGATLSEVKVYANYYLNNDVVSSEIRTVLYNSVPFGEIYLKPIPQKTPSQSIMTEWVCKIRTI